MKLNRLHYDLFNQLLSELEVAKVSPEDLFAKAQSQGITTPDSGENVFFGAEALVYLQSAAELTGDPCLAIRLGQKIGIESYGTFGFALMTCWSATARHFSIQAGHLTSTRAVYCCG